MSSGTALITGAARRIGRSIAWHLAEKGWDVLVHFNTSQVEADAYTSLLRQQFNPQRLEAVKADLSNTGEVEALIPEIHSRFGAFDLLINNASVFKPGYLSETSASLFSEHLTVNFFSPFILMRDFAAYCQHGNIINFVDTRITTNKSDFAAYSLSKKGLWELTKMAALEFGPGIRVNAIAPGVTLAPADRDEAYLLNLAKNIPMKRPGGVDPILQSIDYILNNEHLTGQLLFADGGENLGRNP